ncbi:MAG: polysaccharide deacetylase family protein [Traorella sp.]
MKKEKKRRKRIRIDRLLMLIGACIMAILLIVLAISQIIQFVHPKIIAKEYQNPNMEIKLEDDKVNSSVYSKKNKETKEKMIYAIHIPDFKDKEINQLVDNFVDEIIEENALVTYIDYESSSAFSQYKSYIITATTYSDMDGLNPIEEISSKQLYLNFDQDKLIELKDCLREKAIDKLSKTYECDKSELQLAKIKEDGLEIALLNQKVDYLYNEHTTSFIMNNEHIPTILKNEKINVEKREIDPTKPMVAFTFDDGPSPTNTSKILAALNKVNGRATFFELGYLMEIYPDTVREIVEQGSEVGNHSYDHDWLTSKSISEVIEDIDSVNDIFFSLTGNEIHLVRPPYGDYNSEIKNTLTERIIMWDVDTRDWESRNTSSVISMAKKYTYDGAIVLFHDIYSTTAAAIEELIDYYDSMGYQFVTVSELLEAKGK